jgi:hypothetical protein
VVQPLLHFAITTRENLLTVVIDTPQRPVPFNIKRHKITAFPISGIRR